MKKLFVCFLLSFMMMSCSEDDSDDTPPPPPPPVEMNFYVWDLSVMPPVTKVISATQRAEGESCYVFVADEEWEISVNQEQANELLLWFDEQTPTGSINTSAGIYENNNSMFGTPPDNFDNDPKIYLLLLELEAFGGTQFDGYFNAFDQMSDEQAQTYDQRSNEREILYINCVIRPVDKPATLSVIAHEFVHMIQSNYDSDQMWVEESIAELGMLINGYYTDAGWVNSFLNHPNQSLLGESEYSINYGACLLWGLYLYEQVADPEFFKMLISEQTDGITGINTVLGQINNYSFLDYYFSWLIANYLDDPTLGNGAYGYAMIDINQTATETISSYPYTMNYGIHRYGAEYLNLTNISTSELEINVEAENYEDIYIGFLEYDQANNPQFGFYALDSNPATFTFSNPAFQELPVIITSLSGSNTSDLIVHVSQ